MLIRFIKQTLNALRYANPHTPLKTIGPKPPPEPIGYAPFLDTLGTYPQRAFDEGWITDAAAADRYEANLSEAAGDSGQGLTAKGYALLYYPSCEVSPWCSAGQPTMDRGPARSRR